MAIWKDRRLFGRLGRGRHRDVAVLRRGADRRKLGNTLYDNGRPNDGETCLGIVTKPHIHPAQFLCHGRPTTWRQISIASPVARALVGKRAGDVVVLRRPRGDIEVTVVSVTGPASNAAAPEGKEAT
jgi:hypothetical protein